MVLRYIVIRALTDNNMYLFYNEDLAFSVDPYDYKTISLSLEKELPNQSGGVYSAKDIKGFRERSEGKRRLAYTFTTHGHLDHSGGDANLLKSNRNTIHVTGVDGNLNDGATVNIGHGVTVKCIATPCHTDDSFCYYVVDRHSELKYLLTGDTVFFLGCGKFGPGRKGKDMVNALTKIAEEVDGNTLMLYGHDYKKNDLLFAEHGLNGSELVEIPSHIKKMNFLTLNEEMQYNPFFRAAMDKNWEESCNKMDDLRKRKNMFTESNSERHNTL